MNYTLHHQDIKSSGNLSFRSSLVTTISLSVKFSKESFLESFAYFGPSPQLSFLLPLISRKVIALLLAVTRSRRQTREPGAKKSVANEGKTSPWTSLEALRTPNAPQRPTQITWRSAQRRVIATGGEPNPPAPGVRIKTIENEKQFRNRCKFNYKYSSRSLGVLRRTTGD